MTLKIAEKLILQKSNHETTTTMTTWRDVKKQIDKSKDWHQQFTQREKRELEKIYDLASNIDELRQAHVKDKGSLEKTSCMVGVTRAFIKIIQPYADKNPAIKHALKVCDEGLEAFAKGYEVVALGLALKAFNINPGGACAAAYGGPAIAKVGVDFLRWVAPSLDTDAETKRIEDKVLTLVGGGASLGAGAGALIGGGIGFLFGGIGAAAGAAIGAALGGPAGTFTGALIIALE